MYRVKSLKPDIIQYSLSCVLSTRSVLTTQLKLPFHSITVAQTMGIETRFNKEIKSWIIVGSSFRFYWSVQTADCRYLPYKLTNQVNMKRRAEQLLGNKLLDSQATTLPIPDLY